MLINAWTDSGKIYGCRKLHDDLTYRVIAIHPGWIRTDMGGPPALDYPLAAAQRIVALLADATPLASGSFVDSYGTAIAP